MEDLKTILNTVTFADGSHLSDGLIEDIKRAIEKAGYIRLPNYSSNITIASGDNAPVLMTEDEWREKFGG